MATTVKSQEFEALLLPNHPSVTTDDPLGFSNMEEYPVPVYPILQSHLLNKFGPDLRETPQESLFSTFISTLSDLSYTLNNHPDPNLNILKSCLSSKANSRFCIESIIQYASKLSTLFPSGSLLPLRNGEARIYTKSHLLSIVSHQLILTLSSPKWNDWGGVNLRSWYSDADGNLEPKRTYTSIVLDYLTQSSPSSESQEFSFHLYHCHSTLDFITKTPLIPLEILEQPVESGFPVITLPTENFHTTYIISSHRLIGHGPSATQEELILASVPELLPASTFTPPLEENTALAVTARAGNGFTPTAIFTGHGRTARVDDSYNREDYESKNMENRIRVDTFLFLNATELDTIDVPESESGVQVLPDFLPDMLEKDLLKAYTGFSGVFGSQAKGRGKNQRIVTVPWGSGAFGGDIRVKLLILWVAASFAAVKLKAEQQAELVFMVKQMVIDAKEIWWKEMLRKIQDSVVGADDVWRALLGLRERSVGNVFEALVESLGLAQPRMI